MKHEGMTKCDKEELVMPVLGLWSIILKHRNDKHIQAVLDHIRESRDRFFPPSFEFMARRQAETQAPCMLAGDVSQYKDVIETRELFGNMAEKMERRILSNASSILHPNEDIEVVSWSWYLDAVSKRKSEPNEVDSSLLDVV